MAERKKLEEYVLSPIQPSKTEIREKQRESRKKMKSQDIWDALRGEDGDDGISVEKAEINKEGHLILALSDGRVLDVGRVVGEQGEKGDVGSIDIDEIVSRVRDLIPDPDPVDIDKIVAAVRQAIEFPVQKTALEIIEEIKELGIKIPSEVVEGLDKLLEKLEGKLRQETNDRFSTLRLSGGNTNIRLKSNGSVVGQVETINFVNGSFTSVGDGREVNYTAPASGGGALAIITATGTIDDSNTSFTFADTPTVVIINGSIYRNGSGVTITGTAVTTSFPVGTGGFIFGLS